MTLYRQGKIWYYDFTVRGTRHAGSTGETNKTKAQAVHDRLRVQFKDGANIRQIWRQTKAAMVGRNAGIPMEFEAVWKHFQSHGISNACPQRMQQYRHHIRLFLKWLEENHGRLAVGEVTSAMAAAYMAKIRSEPGANSTKNEYLLALKMLFQSFDENAGVIENPFAEIKRLPARSVPREVFTQEELQLIGEHATGDVLDICLTALYTGLREGDICNLRWSSVSHDLRWIHLDRMSKTERPVDIPVMPRLREHLASLPRAGEYVYPRLKDLYTNHKCTLSQMFKSFLREIGITEATHEVEGYARAMSTKDVHSFRHTFVYLAACNNIPLPVVQAIVGHASPTMTRIYMDHASQTDKQHYLSAMPDLLSGRRDATPSITIGDVIAMLESDAPRAKVVAALRVLADDTQASSMNNSRHA